MEEQFSPCKKGVVLACAMGHERERNQAREPGPDSLREAKKKEGKDLQPSPPLNHAAPLPKKNGTPRQSHQRHHSRESTALLPDVIRLVEEVVVGAVEESVPRRRYPPPKPLYAVGAHHPVQPCLENQNGDL